MRHGTRISPGKEWDEVIEKELRVTRCIVVLWSQQSVQSRWVKAEANVGLERDILVPAVIENEVQIPWAFRRVEAAQLANWLKKQGNVRNQEFDQFVEAIAERIGTAPVGPVVEVKPQRGKYVNLKWLGFALSVTMASVLAFVMFPSAPQRMESGPKIESRSEGLNRVNETMELDEAAKKQVQDYLGMAKFYLDEGQTEDALAQLEAKPSRRIIRR